MVLFIQPLTLWVYFFILPAKKCPKMISCALRRWNGQLKAGRGWRAWDLKTHGPWPWLTLAAWRAPLKCSLHICINPLDLYELGETGVCTFSDDEFKPVWCVALTGAVSCLPTSLLISLCEFFIPLRLFRVAVSWRVCFLCQHHSCHLLYPWLFVECNVRFVNCC